MNSPDKTMCGGDSGSPLYFKDGNDYVYIGPLSSVTGISCQYSKDDAMRSNSYWIERTLGVYYVAAYYQESINEAESFLKAKIQEETEAKAAAELKAKQEAEAKASAELKAKQDAEAKASAIKKTTIICVKGKLTKKITALKPKCPSGFKKK